MIALAVVTLFVGVGGESRAFSRAEIGLEPVRAYVDLGPVVVKATRNEQKLRRELQVIADSLGADGFILEDRSPFVIYGETESALTGTPSNVGYVNSPVGVVPFFIGDNVLGAIITSIYRVATWKPRGPVFLRAYTFRDLPEATRNELMSISRKLVFGEITIAQADAQRRDLLAN